MANVPIDDEVYDDDGEPLDVDVDWNEIGEPEEDLNDQDLRLFLDGEQKSKLDQERIGFENFNKFLSKKMNLPAYSKETYSATLITQDLMTRFVHYMCHDKDLDYCLNSINKFVGAVKIRISEDFPDTLKDVFLNKRFYTRLRKCFLRACIQKAKKKGVKIRHQAPALNSQQLSYFSEFMFYTECYEERAICVLDYHAAGRICENFTL